MSKPGLVGPPIVLVRDQPTEIEVVNKLKDPTAIHWHGIELESYYDSVPGWSGSDKQITPPIAPGGSFVARIKPPRAGTFIYHTHWHGQSQLTNGIYGPLIVLPPGEKFDPTSDLTFIFSISDFGALQEVALIKPTPQSKALTLEPGKKVPLSLHQHLDQQPGHASEQSTTYRQCGGKPTTLSLPAQSQRTCCSIFSYPSRKSTRTQTLSFVSPTAAAQ